MRIRVADRSPADGVAASAVPPTSTVIRLERACSMAFRRDVLAASVRSSAETLNVTVVYAIEASLLTEYPSRLIDSGRGRIVRLLAFPSRVPA
jgi:hypothetical protein